MTPEGRLRLVLRCAHRPIAHVAAEAGISRQCLSKWKARYDKLGEVEPSEDIALVPAFDPWVNGPGTSDSRIVANARRGLVTKGSNLVLCGGVVVGTWRAAGSQLTVAWFDEAGPAPVEHLQAGAGRLVTSLSRDLELRVTGVPTLPGGSPGSRSPL